jgi:uncharacterized protein
MMKETTQTYPWGHERRLNTYTDYFRKYFGQRVQKLSIDAGFTCPNRDGTKGVGGCTYCNNDGFNPSYCQPEKSITQQIEEGKEFHLVRYRKASKYLAYFQAYSNSYAPLNVLKTLYEEALSHPDVIGLVIGTRPDCVDAEKLDYLAALAEKHYIQVEYGIESCYNDTLLKINRGHSFEACAEAITETTRRGIKTAAHIIFGFPWETRERMLAEAEILNKLPLDSIKFHQLQIVKGTIMEKQYLANPEMFSFFTVEEYIDFFIDFLEQLNPAFVIERYTSEVPPRFLAGPGWGLIRTNQLLLKLEKRLEERETWQGRLYT